MLRFYDYDTDTTLNYETNVSASKKIMDQNVIEHTTLWWVKTIQRIRNPLYKYNFTLMWVNWPDFYVFLNSLRINNYAQAVTFPKKDFWLEDQWAWSRIKAFVEVTEISDDNYKSLKLDDVDRLIDVRLTVTPFEYY